jgi:7,8-dihydropterin-6-yl-methyl-4-(beta-D-ribofuranosyl)aminobenzene 5'-phosphate synthase
MKLTIIYDNETQNPHLKADWGFAALIEAHDKTILFDTGGNGRILLGNMHSLKLELMLVTDIFISHHHFDHTGGLSHFLNVNNEVIVHAPQSFRGVRSVKKVLYYNKPKKLFNGFYTTGELDNIEQALIVETSKGLILVVGCSHPPMEKIISAARHFGRIYGIIGGLHGFDKYELFNDFGLICPTHCTQNIIKIKEQYPENFLKGGAGRIIVI